MAFDHLIDLLPDTSKLDLCNSHVVELTNLNFEGQNDHDLRRSNIQVPYVLLSSRRDTDQFTDVHRITLKWPQHA